MPKLFIASTALLASATYAWAPSQKSANYYNNSNFSVNSNGTVTRTPKYQTSQAPGGPVSPASPARPPTHALILVGLARASRAAWRSGEAV
jgi:hypothetical protein